MNILIRFLCKLKHPLVKRILENFSSLLALQIANYLFPLITLPYLSRILGAENYGIIAFAAAFANYFKAITDYGFNLTATRDIARNSKDIKKVADIFSTVLYAKILLILISSIIASILIWTVPKFSVNPQIFIFSLLASFGVSLFPDWFFQGLEKMKFITILNLIVKIIFTTLIFILVKERSDFLIVPILNAFSFLIAVILSLYIIFNNYGIHLQYPRAAKIKSTLKQGFNIFVADFIPIIYHSSASLILGFFTSFNNVGIFTAGHKILNLANQMLTALQRSFFPLLNKDMKYFKIYKHTIILCGVLSFLFLVIFSSIIVKVFLSDQFSQTSIVIRILSPWPLFLTIIYAYGTTKMLVEGHGKLYSIITILTSFFGFITSFPLIYFFQALGASVNISLSLGLYALAIILYGNGFRKSETSKEISL